MENNTEYIVKNAAKRLHFLKILKGYNAPREDMKTFYLSAIRSILEYGTKIWHGILTEEQSKDIERIQRRGMKIICPEKTYEQALIECGVVWKLWKIEEKNVHKIDKRYERSYT